MYANNFAADRGLKPGSMTLALAMTVLPIAGLIVSTNADTIKRLLDPPINVINVEPIKDPPPDPKPKPKTADPINERVYTPPIDLPPISDTKLVTTPTFPVDPPPPIQPGTGTSVTPPPPIVKPVVIGASYDPRFNSVLQPPYPANEIRGGNAGRVVLRVLIGADGRVKQVERVSAASDAFFEAAQRQALTKWRFKPATIDGVAIEQWKTMSLRFELTGQ